MSVIGKVYLSCCCSGWGSKGHVSVVAAKEVCVSAVVESGKMNISAIVQPGWNTMGNSEKD